MDRNAASNGGWRILKRKEKPVSKEIEQNDKLANAAYELDTLARRKLGSHPRAAQNVGVEIGHQELRIEQAKRLASDRGWSFVKAMSYLSDQDARRAGRND